MQWSMLVLLIALLLATSVECSENGNDEKADKRLEDITLEDNTFSWITDLVDKIKDRLNGKGTDHLQLCQKAKDRGEVPSAEKRVSPIETFGFPYFNEKSRSVTVRPGVTLSYMFGKRQPIKLGSRDYVMSGWAKELMAFFKCFEEYEVIGSSLAEDGHWYPGTGSLKIQLSNVNPNHQGLNVELWEMLFKISMDRIIKYLNPLKIIAEKEAMIMGSKKAVSTLTEMQKALAKIKEWLPGSDKFIAKILEIYQEEGELKDKVKKLIDFVEAEDKRKDWYRKQWIGLGNVHKEKKLLVTLTMYTKPENRVRTTYNFGRATVKMSEVADALQIFLDQDKEAPNKA